jgi:tetratricopeptide (TPR) repeat protein
MAPQDPSLDAQALYKLGNAKKAKRDWAGAIADYSGAIELKPDFAEAYYGRGTAKNAAGDVDGGVADLEKALELDPKIPNLREVIRILKKKRAKGAAAGPKKIPATKNTLALLTNFSQAYAWVALRDAIRNPDAEFRANVDFVTNSAFADVTPENLLSRLSDESKTFALIIDRMAISHDEHPILVVDLRDQPGRSFRVTAAALWEVENNLSLANMEFDEFAGAVDDDGIFRGFQGQ